MALFFLFKMKTYLFFVFFFFTQILFSQNLDDFYVSSPHQDGTLYFVYPQKMAVSDSSQQDCVSALLYDCTYLNSKDSVVLLCSVFTKEIFKPDSVFIKATGCEIGEKVEVLYYEPYKRKNWVCRIRCKICYRDWSYLYNLPQPYSLELKSIDDSKKISYIDSYKKWKKQREYFTKLIHLIDLNKEVGKHEEEKK